MSVDVDSETRHLIEDELRTGRFHDAGALVRAAVSISSSLARTSDELARK